MLRLGGLFVDHLHHLSSFVLPWSLVGSRLGQWIITNLRLFGNKGARRRNLGLAKAVIGAKSGHRRCRFPGAVEGKEIGRSPSGRHVTSPL